MNEQKVDPSVQDDEFQFEDFDKFESPDDESAHVDPSAASVANKFDTSLSDKKDHRKMIVIAIVLIILLGFGLNSLLGHIGGVKIPKENSQLNAPKSEEQITVAPNTALVTASAPVVAPTPPLASEMEHLNDVISAQQQSMSQMQASINALQESVGALNGSLTDLSSQMTDVLNKIPVKAVPRPKAAVITPVAPPRPVFSIRALVPGRAWLQSNDGQSITVIDGDQVPGYGSVQDIDLNAGQVVLSDGTIIGYNLNS